MIVKITTKYFEYKTYNKLFNLLLLSINLPGWDVDSGPKYSGGWGRSECKLVRLFDFSNVP